VKKYINAKTKMKNTRRRRKRREGDIAIKPYGIGERTDEQNRLGTGISRL
jgi:hypothetical protein